MSSDWAVIVPIPASIAANREVLFSEFGDAVALVHCLRNTLPTGQAVVAVADELYAEVQALLAATDVSATVLSVTGPGTRSQCLAAGLAELDSALPYVLVHDIRSSLASAAFTDRILDSLRSGHQVVIPALGVVDSIKTVDAAGTVTDTVDRAQLRSAQYPRGFHRQHLAAILAEAGAQGGDELEMARCAGLDITVIDGDADAFELDIPRDVALADAIYRCRLAAQR